MITITIQNLDWITIRQAISLSLATNKQCRIKDALTFLNAHQHFTAVLSDFEEFFCNHNFGIFSIEGNDVLFFPKPLRFGTYHISINPYSSAIEMMLLLMPTLFFQDFRSKLFFSGVTHAPYSYGTTWLKESFLTFLEHIGFYASCTLRRFGFYGSGGGFIEAKVFPHEKKTVSFEISHQTRKSIRAARIYIAHLENSIAMHEKELLCQLLHIDENQVGILEICDCDGAANHVEIYCSIENFPIIFSEALPTYDFTGKFIFSKNQVPFYIQQIVQKAQHFIANPQLPFEIERELALYDAFTEIPYPLTSTEAQKTRLVVESFC